MEKVVVSINLFNSSAAIVQNRPVDLLFKAVDWFLYNGKTGMIGKVDAWLR